MIFPQISYNVCKKSPTDPRQISPYRSHLQTFPLQTPYSAYILARIYARVGARARACVCVNIYIYNIRRRAVHPFRDPSERLKIRRERAPSPRACRSFCAVRRKPSKIACNAFKPSTPPRIPPSREKAEKHRKNEPWRVLRCVPSLPLPSLA